MTRSDHEHRLALELHRLVAASGNLVHRYAAQNELNPSDLGTLLHTWEAELEGRRLSASQLAAKLNVTPAAVTYLVDRLVARGHLERTTNPGDRRQVLLKVSPEGGELGHEFLSQQIFSRALAERSDADLALFTEILADLTVALNTKEYQE